jgi:RimJ/RimL family protein N-acetyltransferase
MKSQRRFAAVVSLLDCRSVRGVSNSTDAPRISLRSERVSDLSILTGGDSRFDDFGPRPPRTRISTPDYAGSGALVIVDENDEVCGYVSWHWNHWGPTPESHCPMLGIWLRESWRGRSVGRLAQRRVAEILFEQTTTNRVEAHTDVENVAEWRALEAAGFTREGIIRGAHWRPDGYHDGYLYSILRGDLTTDIRDQSRPAPSEPY